MSRKRKNLSIRERLHLVFNSVSRKEIKGVMADTLKDLRRPKEIGIFIVSSVVPGGWIGYAAYRIANTSTGTSPRMTTTRRQRKQNPTPRPEEKAARAEALKKGPEKNRLACFQNIGINTATSFCSYIFHIREGVSHGQCT